MSATGCRRELAAPRELPPCSGSELEQVRAIEAYLLTLPQVELPVEEFLHGGMFTRSCLIPAGVVITGAQIKAPTVVILSGHCRINAGGEVREVEGYAVLKGQPGRKQVVRALEDTHMTIVMISSATSLREAEEDLTDEADRLRYRSPE